MIIICHRKCLEERRQVSERRGRRPRRFHPPPEPRAPAAAQAHPGGTAPARPRIFCRGPGGAGDARPRLHPVESGGPVCYYYSTAWADIVGSPHGKRLAWRAQRKEEKRPAPPSQTPSAGGFMSRRIRSPLGRRPGAPGRGRRRTWSGTRPTIGTGKRSPRFGREINDGRGIIFGGLLIA
jgi:hypothetical protein